MVSFVVCEAIQYLKALQRKIKPCRIQKKKRNVKTNAQKKWAVKTRPFGREASIVTLQKSSCKQFKQFACLLTPRRSRRRQTRLEAS
jgi:hypothetical protein